MGPVLIPIDIVENPAMFDKAMSIVSEDRRQRVLACRRQEDRQRSLCAGLALAVCLHRVGVAADTPIVRTEAGQPRLSNGLPYRFSLSHSGRYAVCVLSDSAVGVDIQEHRSINVPELAERFFTAAEASWVRSAPTEERDTRFLRLWTAKESVLKAEGLGLSGGLSRCHIQCGEHLQAPSPWRLTEYTWPGYAITVCGTKPCTEPLTVISSFDSVLPR